MILYANLIYNKEEPCNFIFWGKSEQKDVKYRSYPGMTHPGIVASALWQGEALEGETKEVSALIIAQAEGLSGTGAGADVSAAGEEGPGTVADVSAAGEEGPEAGEAISEAGAACRGEGSAGAGEGRGGAAAVTVSGVARYEIRGVSYEPADTMRILLNIKERAENSPDIILSQEILFWVQAAKLAAELIISQRFMPLIKKHDGSEHGRRDLLYTVWSIIADRHKDITRIKALRSGMPPMLRTCFERNTKLQKVEFPDEQETLSAFFDWLCDGVVRDAVSQNTQMKIDHEYNKSEIEKMYIHSLYKKSGRITGTSRKAIKTMAAGYNLWIKPFKAKKPDWVFRTCFKISSPQEFLLEEAAASKNTWSLEYLLQASDDPSLLIQAHEVWTSSGRSHEFLKRKFKNPQERLLEDLGTASRIFPPILKSLYESAPSGVELTEEEAWQFLREGAVILEESGFGILAPSWWSKPSSLSLKLRAKTPRKTRNASTESVFNLETLLSYDWRLSLDGQELDEEEFERLAGLKVPLVRVRGKWVRLGSEQIEALAKLWEGRRDQGQKTLGELLRLSIGKQDIATGMAVEDIECSGGLKILFGKLKGEKRISKLPTPEGFCGVLRPYQVRGFSWLSFLRDRHIGACLADDMGLGKTIQFIALLLHDKKNNQVQSPVLLICPTSVVGNWEREIRKFAPGIKAMIHHGTGRRLGRGFVKEALRHDIVISTYALAHRDNEHFRKIVWSGVVLDEAQNIKNPSSKQTQALKRLDRGYGIALTGTPVENRLSELWSIMDFLNPGYLGSAEGFRREYILPIEKAHDIQAGQKLRSLIEPFILRRLKTDPRVIKDLPEKIETRVYCALTREQATLYEAVVRDMIEKIEELDGIERKGMVLSALSQFKQICNHPALYLKDGSELDGRSGKLERLYQILEEILSEGDKVLIFTQFASMGELLRRALVRRFKSEVLFLHGGVDRNEREEMTRVFQSDKNAAPIFILSLKAGGVGLNLTAANHVIHYDRWWNPAVENQATDRAFRIGQKKNVQVHKFVCPGTLEEKIDEMIERKTELADSIIGSGESWLTEMSNSQLRELFSLNYADDPDEEG